MDFLFYHAFSQCNVMINETTNIENGINGTRTDGGGTMPGEETGGQQPVPRRNQNTATLKWTKEINRIVMECYIKSDPSKRGYRKSHIL